MGEAHSRALLARRRLDVPLRPELVSISGRDREKVETARARYLVGEIDAVSAVVTTFVPGRRVDDHFVATVEFENGVAPHGATFEDGYRCAEVCDAIVRSAESGRREFVSDRGVEE